jgi:hypothetical protein
MVLEGGYVTFGNPLDNHWYQIIVVSGQAKVRDLGVITSTNGKSLRELVDGKVREVRKGEYYRIKLASPGAMNAARTSPLAHSSEARARYLRDYVKRLR